MHIVLAGQMTLSLLEPALGGPVPSAGLPFPAISELALEYLRRGHRVSAVTTGSDIDAPVRRSRGALEVVVLPGRGRGRERAFDFFRAERHAVTAEIDRVDPDVVHAHWTYEFGLAARAARAPSLVTVHDWAPAIARHNRHPYWYFRWAMQAACLARRGALSAPSAYIADRVERWYRQSCAVVPNGVDLARFVPVSPSDPPVVGMLNNGFTGRKNVSSALEAWPAVRSRRPEAVLRLAGPDYEANGTAHRWAAERDLLQGVEFAGPLPPEAVPEWFAGLSAFLHTSREESFGLVLVEAMAAGVPVVANRDGGAVADVMDDAGLAVDVDDPAAIAEQVLRVLDEPPVRDRLREAGKRRATIFSLEASTDAYLDLLTAAADGRPARLHR